jgi:hypothetical protein
MMRSSTPYKLDWQNHPARGIAKDTVLRVTYGHMLCKP